MTDTTSRFIQLDNWIFEVKSVRAIKVNSYGKPYDAIANVSFNGNSAYIDGLMTREDESFNKEDYQVFMRLCQKMGMKQMQFDRFKNNQFKLETVNLQPIEKEETPKLSLVR
ncbi:hypothetical protein [Candidatus Colwellia aromaticivorans]|uniref:hypothetical protein n=1 Tax=Candidatus Colwellia aromaticivorans TaxID=2267621 RepID=UPI000DF1B319|nr:hypothetical protein [Candidatus Colwellia aromaticivorans]